MSVTFGIEGEAKVLLLGRMQVECVGVPPRKKFAQGFVGR
jgi:hypothetical protein